MTRPFPATDSEEKTVSNSRKTRKPSHPVQLGAGRYAIFQDPDGNGVISYRPDGQEEDSHQVVPAKFWALLMKILSGEVKGLSPVEMMKMLMGAGQ